MLHDLKSKKPSEIEEEILKFWRQNKIFEKSFSKKSPKGDYIFYDGPPFANGLPHYGHILASIIKDVIPRYQTMKGYKVPRKWGWDCHGLPVENEVEKIFQLKAKKDIEKFGIGKFNEEARKNVLLYVDEWKRIIPRIGRWADMERAYKTMDTDYTESVWWVFKSLFEKGLVYEGYKAMHLCPRCETTLANFEVSQGYKDITDISVIVKFELEEAKNTYILAWTTTPWTLPGNVALAINPNIEYSKVGMMNEESGIMEYYILAKDRLGIILTDKKYEVLEKFKGKDLIGKKYKPLFDYYVKDKNLKNCENGWKVYGADFVTTEEGTGVVHIAPAFGEDDMNLGKEYNLPFIQHVSIDGRFQQEVKDFAGMPVKPKEEHQSADIEIIKWLVGQNKLFSKEKIIHSYPHCWRCETPLLNYASASWFVKVTAIKNKLIANNKKINWVPSHIKNGRFGKWLEEARDWAISRSRFWGAPIAVWRCQTAQNQKFCGKQIVIGSVGELRKYIKKSGNKYFAMRHGEAEHNVKKIASANLKNKHSITKKGKKEIAAAAKILLQAQDKIDLIFSSDFARTKETAELVADYLSVDKKKIIFDNRLREVNVGIFDGQPAGEYHKYFSSLEEKFYKIPPQGENLTQLKNRVSEFLYEIEERYSGKNILIVSHEYTIWNMFAGVSGADVKKAVAMKIDKSDFIKTGEIMPLDFTSLPHNENYELDLHRPYIDEIELQCDCDGRMKRIPEVFDCWFESGAMPYGQAHYPFAFAQNQKSPKQSKLATGQAKIKNQKFGFPAEFIAEGLDQTRGWFYTLLVLSTALFGKTAYKNVIVNGIILAEDGQKMSKRLRNYPDPVDIVNKYGADALRLYLLSSSVVRAENLNFSERGVDEIYKKIILRLWNVFSFYDLYAEKKIKVKSLDLRDMKSKNVLDIWILVRLNKLIVEITKAMENYELDRAVRPIGEFIDDLSTWYIRRSRNRFKTPFASHQHIKTRGVENDADDAIKTTKFVLLELSKIFSPFMPFISEAFFGLLGGGKESVHLEEWPIAFSQNQKSKIKNQKMLEDMIEVRKICSLGLEARQKAGIKVRQPIASLKIKNQKSKTKNSKELLDLIKDEINVKEIIFDNKIENEVEINTNITPELKAEGEIRELVRIIQDLRKEAKFTPKNRIVLNISTGDYLKNLINRNMDNLKKEVGADKIEFMKTEKNDAEMETKIEDNSIWIGIKKIKI